MSRRRRTTLPRLLILLLLLLISLHVVSHYRNPFIRFTMRSRTFQLSSIANHYRLTTIDAALPDEHFAIDSPADDSMAHSLEGSAFSRLPGPEGIILQPTQRRRIWPLLHTQGQAYEHGIIQNFAQPVSFATAVATISPPSSQRTFNFAGGFPKLAPKSKPVTFPATTATATAPPQLLLSNKTYPATQNAIAIIISAPRTPATGPSKTKSMMTFSAPASVISMITVGNPSRRLTFHQYAIHHGYVILLVAFPTLLLITRRHYISRRTANRLQKNLCPTCAYDLRESPTRCPECGTIPQPTTPAT
jgi:hypothetical protein